MPDSRHIKPPIQIAKRKKSGGNGDGRSEERSIKKRKTRNVHPGLTRDMHLDLEHGVNFAVGNMDKHLLADHIARQTKRFLPELSPVELEDLRIPGIYFSWQVLRRIYGAMNLLFTKQYPQRRPSKTQATGLKQGFSKTYRSFSINTARHLGFLRNSPQHSRKKEPLILS